MPWNLYTGDVINYDWTGNGTIDHITLVVMPQTSTQTAQVVSHYADGINSWHMNGAATYYGTHIVACPPGSRGGNCGPGGCHIPSDE